MKIATTDGIRSRELCGSNCASEPARCVKTLAILIRPCGGSGPPTNSIICWKSSLGCHFRQSRNRSD